MKKKTLQTVAFMAILLLSACTENGTSNTQTQEGQIERLYIAHVLDESTENTAAANEWLRGALEAYLGIEVVHMSEVSHTVGIEALRSGHLDIMFASAFTALNAQDVVDIEIAGTLTHSIVNPLTTLFITNNDDIKTLDDLRGHTFAFVSPTSSSGYFFPANYLTQKFDLTGTLITQPGHFFSATSFSGSQESSIVGTTLGDFDAAAVLATVFAGVLESGIIGPDEIRIIGETPPGPDSSYIMRAELPREIKDQIQSFFQNLDNETYFLDAWGFKELRYVEGNYDALEDLRRIIAEFELTE